MTAAELREIRENVGITQAEAARLVGVVARQWRRWEAGHQAVNPSAARLIRCVERWETIQQYLDGLDDV